MSSFKEAASCGGLCLGNWTFNHISRNKAANQMRFSLLSPATSAGIILVLMLMLNAHCVSLFLIISTAYSPPFNFPPIHFPQGRTWMEGEGGGGGGRAPASEPRYGSRRPPHPACPQGNAHNEMYNETIRRVKDVRAQTLRHRRSRPSAVPGDASRFCPLSCGRRRGKGSGRWRYRPPLTPQHTPL